MTTKDYSDLPERDSKAVCHPWSGEPMAIVAGNDCTVTDANGKEYIDFTAGYFVNNAGHCHPKVIAAAKDQLDKVTQVSFKATTPPVVELAERIAAATPKTLTKTVFLTGGSEANENAFKMARQYTGKTDIAALDNAYHGLTLGTLAACASQKYRDTAGVDLGDNVFFIPNSYCYRCPHADNCQTQCLDGVEEQFEKRPNTAAIVAEPLQAVGGLFPPQAWWDRLDDIRRKRNILLIADEVQTGFGRTGKMFAIEHFGLEPDILTGGKGMSGGVGAMASVTANQEICDKYFGGTTATSGGNAVSAAAGTALFDTIVEEGLLDNCTRMGEYFTEAVAKLDDPWVGDIRFRGLFGGVELVTDRETKEVLPKDKMQALNASVLEDGMMITLSGPHGNVLRIQPPLTIQPSHIDALMDALKRAFAKVRA